MFNFLWTWLPDFPIYINFFFNNFFHLNRIFCYCVYLDFDNFLYGHMNYFLHWDYDLFFNYIIVINFLLYDVFFINRTFDYLLYLDLYDFFNSLNLLTFIILIYLFLYYHILIYLNIFCYGTLYYPLNRHWYDFLNCINNFNWNLLFIKDLLFYNYWNFSHNLSFTYYLFFNNILYWNFYYFFIWNLLNSFIIYLFLNRAFIIHRLFNNDLLNLLNLLLYDLFYFYLPLYNFFYYFWLLYYLLKPIVYYAFFWNMDNTLMWNFCYYLFLYCLLYRPIYHPFNRSLNNFIYIYLLRSFYDIFLINNNLTS